ncbi:MAG: hypothetical protein RL754_141 [Bacteroidota bacterium]|jgi:Na+/H+-translocating membrane pyrophosphatase
MFPLFYFLSSMKITATMKNIVIFLLVLTAFSAQAQDVSIFHRYEADRLKLEPIPSGMTLEEYQLLSRDIRMIDIGYAMAVPGYTHFKAQETKLGYAVLAVDLVSAGVIAMNVRTISNSGLTIAQAQSTGLYASERAAINAGALMIFGAFAFDHIHGKWALERKHEALKYRYSGKISAVAGAIEGSPSVGVVWRF